MEFDGNFRHYGQLDVAALRACLAQQSEQAWFADRSRQKRFAVHSDTETLHLIYDEDFRHANPTILPAFACFAAALQPVMELISGQGDGGWVVRCILTRLPGGCGILRHRDSGLSLSHARRFHIPIVTNPDVEFSVGDETIRMAPGEIWEINNLRPHGVDNRGVEDRVHLILDWALPLTQSDVLRHVAAQRRRASAALP